MGSELRAFEERGTDIDSERTGTIPFMAIDLLNDDYWQGNIARHYRHDLEGLILVLSWVFLQYEGSKITGSRFQAWCMGDYEVCP
jgi:hypothetical protein